MEIPSPHAGEGARRLEEGSPHPDPLPQGERGISESRSFFRPCWVEIDEAALRSNWRALREKISPQTGMLAVVKADGYGLGILTASKIAVEEGALMLGVSSIEEGIRLREANFTIPVLILGSLYPFESFPLLFQHRLTPTIASLEAAQALELIARRRGTRLPVHLKIDSGFGRIGVSIPNALEFIRQVRALADLDLEGLYTHFASADIDPEFTRRQAKAFLSVVHAARKEGISPRWVHMANSSALLRFPEFHETLVRPGLAYYGIPPYPGSAAKITLDAALAWKTRIIFLKTIAAGSSVSYARTWTAKRPTRVATLAVGYADGLPRLLSNRGQVLLHGKRVPILGRVTMDMTMVDVTDLPDCHVGDEAVILGRVGKAEITAVEMAEWAETNAYEIVCRIGPRVPRVGVTRG